VSEREREMVPGNGGERAGDTRASATKTCTGGLSTEGFPSELLVRARAK
jgi:hypothetical protein